MSINENENIILQKLLFDFIQVTITVAT
ncbi:hypothetical protein EMIT079MI2_890001 [Bacillus sp. IT-79MI2]